MNRLFSMVLLAALACCVCAGCGKDDDGVRPKKETIKNLSETDHIIYNLLQSYSRKNMDYYTELLHDDYVWYMLPDDVGPSDPAFLTREEDIAFTERIFEQSILLELVLRDALWSEVDSLAGQPCEDCWVTIRKYEMTVQLAASGTIYTPSGYMQIVAVPVVENDKTKYTIYSACDLGYPLRSASRQPFFSTFTWGQIKLMFYEPPGG